MPDVSIDMDAFASTLNEIAEKVNHDVLSVTPDAVRKGLKKGASEWRKNAPARRGKYKKSIRWHMTNGGEQTPTGEIGSPTMPGLPHLLEKGHARIGGGRVRAIPHIAPAAEVAFDETEKALLDNIGRVL